MLVALTNIEETFLIVLLTSKSIISYTPYHSCFSDLTLVPSETSQVLKVGDGLSLQCKMKADTNYDGRSIVWTYSKVSGGGEGAIQVEH